MRLTPNEIAHCIATTKLPAAEWPVAIAVALAESQGDTEALGVNDKGTKPTPAPVTWGSFDCGLWQINNYWHGAKFPTLNWRDPYANAELAYRAWLEGKRTWGPWSTFNSGAHLKYLPHAADGLRYPVPVMAYPPVVAPVVNVPPANVTTQTVDTGPLEAQLALLMARVVEVRGKFS